MTRRHIPVLSYNDELSSKKLQVYKSLIEGVSEAIKNNKSDIKLCEVKNTNSYITISKDMWSDSLVNAMRFYIEKEEYEKCSKIKKLIEKL